MAIGTIPGAGSVSLPERRRLTIVGPSPVSLNSRKNKTPISEASHLTWVLRCGRAINQENHTTW
ncbi:hypothetical protein BJV74DRAFT_831076 [Russula compacta]|nr:hypothetical protein BJV74DRAFT_831076 [Russula compacta]